MLDGRGRLRYDLRGLDPARSECCYRGVPAAETDSRGGVQL